MTEKKRRYRDDGIKSMDDLIGRCKRDEDTGCLIVQTAKDVWIPAIQSGRSVSWAYTFFSEQKPQKGKQWVAACGRPCCIEPTHRRNGGRSELAKSVRKTLSQQHRARITAGRRKLGKYTPELARDIRAAEGTYKEIGARFGLDQSSIGKIKAGTMWAEAAPNSSVFNWRP